MNHIGKRAVTLALCAALITSMFAGCSSKPAGSADSSSAASAPGTPASSAAGSSAASAEDPLAAYAPDPNKKYKISWTCYQMAPTKEDGEMIQYFEDKFNVDFDVWNIDNQQYEEILNIRLASGEIPDLVHITPPSNLQKYMEQDVLAEIPEGLLEKYMPNSLAGLTEHAPGYIDFGKVDGKQYGIPSVSMGNKLRLPVVYREDWLNKLGLAVPTTIDEYEKVLYAFANDDPDGNGSKDTYGLSQDGLLALYGMYGAVPDEQYYQKKDNKIVFGMIEPEMKEALTYANKWYKEGVLDPEFITGENTGGYWALSHSFINGKIGMTVRGNYYHWVSEGDYMDLDAEGKEVPTPAVQNTLELQKKFPDATVAFGQPLISKTGKQGGIKGYNMLAKFYAIGANASNEKEPGKMAKILEIMDYMGGNPNVEERAIAGEGLEGVHWEWMEKERGTVRKIPPLDTQPNARYEYGSVFWWTCPYPGTQLQDRRTEWGYKNGFDQNGIFSEVQIATPAMAKYKAELQTMREQAYIQMITGDKPLDYFDTFVKEYLAAGGQAILDEVNTWYQGTQS